MTLTMNRPAARNALSPQMLVRSRGLPPDRALQIEEEVSAVVMSSRDAREGPRMFKEKRKPRLIGA